MSGRIDGISGAKHSPLIMFMPLLLSLVGAAFCAWSALGNTMDFCITVGCELSNTTSLWGLSLWWYGTIAFCILTILSLSGKPWLGALAAGFCVFLDLGLLLLLLSTSPCINCLLVGLLFVLIYKSFRDAGKGIDSLPRSVLITIWLVLFIANSGVAARDVLGSWSIYGVSNSNINVYFSPSCASCLTAVKALQDNPQVAYYPVMDMEKDFDAIAYMYKEISKGANLVTALEKARTKAQNDLSFYENIYLYFSLLRNKAKVLMSGSHVVPFIEYKGLPAFLKSAAQSKSGKAEQVEQLHTGSHANTTPAQEIPVRSSVPSSNLNADPVATPENLPESISTPLVQDPTPTNQNATQTGNVNIEPNVNLPEATINAPVAAPVQQAVPTTEATADVEPMETIESIDPINLPQAVPASTPKPQTRPKPPVNNNVNADLPIDTGIAGSCGGRNQSPCPEPELPY